MPTFWDGVVGKDGWLTKAGEHIPGVNNHIQHLHAKHGNTEALNRAKKADPVGAHGSLTKVAEHIPGVTLVVQELHKAHGQQDALERARKADPVGAHGTITKVAEHVPVLNQLVEALHEGAGQKEAAERARRNNPVGKDGFLTQVAEHLPGANNVAQALHRQAGNLDALERARKRDPVGANGTLTQLGEHVPILNDGIRALHLLAGKQEAADRAKAHSLHTMISKDGVVTKLAELLPGTNLVAALLHDAAGNKDEAQRALNLVKSWEKLGSPNGPLAKLAELFPGTDIIACGLHLTNGHYAPAIRALVKTEYVQIEGSVTVKLLIVGLDCVRAQDLVIDHLRYSPKVIGMGSLLADVAANFMDMDRHGGGRRCRRRPDGAVEKKDSVLKQDAIAKALRSINNLVESVIEEQLRNVPELLEGLARGAGERLEEARASNWCLAKTLPAAMPSLEDGLVNAARGALETLCFRHEELSFQPPELQAVVLPEGHRSRKLVQHAGITSATCFAAFFTCMPGCMTFGAGCLSGLVAAGAYGYKEAAGALVPRWNSNNKKAFGTLEKAAAGDSKALVMEVQEERLRQLEAGLCEYAAKFVAQSAGGDLLAGLMPGLLRRLRAWSLGLSQAEGRDADQLMLNVDTERQKVPIKDENGEVQFTLEVPSLTLGVLLDVCRIGGGRLVQRLRVLVPDAQVAKLVNEIREQVATWDLRRLDPRLRGFTREVNLRAQLGLAWPTGSEHAALEVSDISLRLHLPQ